MRLIRAARLLAGALCLIEGVLLLGLAAFYLYELARGGGGDGARVVMSAVLMVVVGVALVAGARAWRQGLTWPRTPTILWNLLLMPVAYNMALGGFWGAWPLGVAAVMAVAAALATPGRGSDHDSEE